VQKKFNPSRLTGVLEVTRSGKGFLLVPDGTDIPIPRESLRSALSGDVVEVNLRQGRRERIGEVVRVLERKKNSFVGVVEKRPDGSYLVADNPRVYMDFLIVGGVGSPAGQKVIADVVNWDSAPPQVTVRRSLGLSGSHDTEMRAILAGHEFEIDFKNDVMQEADALVARGWDDAEIATRRDMRDTLTFTIDPDDAKDFDDAISYQVLEDGSFEIGVHIADVSHYVREGSAIDRQAVARATSVYLVDRTIPMLPPQLSEDLCSLRPDVDRLTYSAIFTIKGTTITERWFGRTIIRSRMRFTYDSADSALTDPTHEHYTTLTAVNTYTKHLRARRIEDGSIVFDRDELKPVLNDKKVVTGFRRIKSTPSHHLIEELMLLANREVATFVRKALGKNDRVFVYRVHDTPNIDKLEELATFLRALGYQLTLTKDGVDQTELNRMFASISGAPEEGLIKTATIRSMARATYSTKNIGHFGLSFKDYVHFTSPIRRYPDLMVHRMLSKVLKGGDIADSPAHIDELALHASEREAEATDAERESVKLKQVEYMATKIGTERTGTISGVTEWGVYVEDVESGAEGMARLSDMTDDTYEHYPKKYAVIGARTKRVIRLGDRVSFKVVRADPEERTIDLQLVQSELLP
jgi:ribonuclease R